MRKIFFILIMVSCLCYSAFSQSADVVERTVNDTEISYGRAAYFSAVALGLVADTDSDESAVEALKRIGVLKDKVSSDDKINMENLAWICFNTWRVEKGLMMRIIPCPRYAFRQLKADGVIPELYDPARIPNGREFLAVITDCIDNYNTRVLSEES